MTKGEKRQARAEERTRKTLEKYYGKKALAEEWKNFDPEYYRRLKDQASKLRDTLIIKGVL